MHNRRYKALQEAVIAMENKVNLQHKQTYSFRRFYGYVWYLQC